MRRGDDDAAADAGTRKATKAGGMSAKERFLAGIRGEPTDRAPVASPTSVATMEQMERTGAWFPAAHRDGEQMARLAAGAHEILGYDAINNPEALLRGTPELVESQARYAVEAGVRVVGPECAVPLRTPLENLRAIRRATEEAS